MVSIVGCVEHGRIAEMVRFAKPSKAIPGPILALTSVRNTPLAFGFPSRTLQFRPKES